MARKKALCAIGNGKVSRSSVFICGLFSWINPLESLLDISDLSILMVSIWIKWFDAKPECIKLFKLDQFMVQSPNALYALFPYRSQFVSDRHWCLSFLSVISKLENVSHLKNMDGLCQHHEKR